MTIVDNLINNLVHTLKENDYKEYLENASDNLNKNELQPKPINEDTIDEVNSMIEKRQRQNECQKLYRQRIKYRYNDKIKDKVIHEEANFNYCEICKKSIKHLSQHQKTNKHIELLLEYNKQKINNT
jgi:hypothetical protein